MENKRMKGGKLYLPDRFLHENLWDTDTHPEQCKRRRSDNPAYRLLKENKKNIHKYPTTAGIIYKSHLFLTCLTIESSVAWFAAACVGRCTLHVPTTRMSANSLKNTQDRTVKPVNSCVWAMKMTQKSGWSLVQLIS